MTRAHAPGLAGRLTAAAEDMPAARVPDDLWRRGRRRHRTRRALRVAAAAAVVLLVALTAFAGGRWDRQAVPAAPGATVPGRLHQPWPWQASVAGDPRGPAAVLVSGGGTFQTLDTPGTFGSLIGVVGRDGSYRMLRYGYTYLQAGQDVLLSPDGRYVAGHGTYEHLISSADGTVSVVDLSTGKERRYPGADVVDPVAWSPDGRRLLINRYVGYQPAAAGNSEAFDGHDTTTFDSGALWLLDLDSGATTRLLDIGRAVPGPAAFAPDGRTVAVQLGRDVTLVDVATGARRVLTTLPAGARLGGAGAYTADGAGLGVFTVVAGCTADCTNTARNARSWRLTVLSSATGAPGATFATFGGASAKLAGWQRDGTAVVVRYVDETSPYEDPAYSPPDAYREVSDVDLLALDPRGGTKPLLDKPTGIVWDLDVAADLVAAGAFGGPSPAPGVFPLARWFAATLLVLGCAVTAAGWLNVVLVRRRRRA
ncbi:hypothetical protein AB0K00_05960 [Dactylosporangium sp. NPDC049525]|uniref:WD40 repeat domain-containing protein n=1 Tax=Dactylosporangium sp. NPDC049525 TaxID=3154730 RepID=UPI003433FD97